MAGKTQGGYFRKNYEIILEYALGISESEGTPKEDVYDTATEA